MGSDVVSGSAGAPHYLLGHTPAELRRLDVQNELYRDATLRALRDAGVGPGMRVLDIGCGTGGVSLLAAEVVGPEGSVLGVDRGERALAAARAHADARGVSNVAFAQAEVDTLDDQSGFDALVGRFVLMHQPRPAEVLAAAARVLRPGGRAVFVESWMALLRDGAHSTPRSPLYDDIVRWKCAVVGGAGADLEAGGRLRRTFRDAGLRQPVARLEARLEGGPDSPYYHYVAESVRSMLPEARRLGLDGYDDPEVDALAGRLRDEVVGLGGTLVVWPVALGWATKA